MSLWSRLRPGDAFLLGTDLVKDPAVLVAAYDDPGGVSASFNKNILSVLNAELELTAAGFAMRSWWTDDAGRFGLSLSVQA